MPEHDKALSRTCVSNSLRSTSRWFAHHGQRLRLLTSLLLLSEAAPMLELIDPECLPPFVTAAGWQLAQA